MSTGRPGANLVIPMGPLVAPADSDVLSVQRLDALNSSFHRGYMQQKQQAEANAKLPLIQAESKVGIAKAKEELEDMQDPDRALIRKKGRQVMIGEADAALLGQDQNYRAAAKEFELREATTRGAIEQLEQNRWRVPDMANFLSKEGVTYDYNPNDPPEKAAAALKDRILEYRDFLKWSGSARAEWEGLQKDKEPITIKDKEGNKRTYMRYFARGLEGPVPEERIQQLKLAQVTSFEQWSAFRKAFSGMAQPDASPAPQPQAQPATTGYKSRVSLINPEQPPQQEQPAAPVSPLISDAVGDNTPVSGGSKFTPPADAVQIGEEAAELPNAPAEIIRQFSALVEAPGLLRQIRQSYDSNREGGKMVYNFTVPGLKDDEGKPITFDLAPITGLFASKNPWDVKAVELNQAVGSAVATFARGIFREVGVLSDKDVLRYKDLLPGAKTPEGAAKLLFAILGKTLDRSAMVASILNYDTKQGRELADMFGYTKAKLDAGRAEYRDQIIAARAENEALFSGTPAAAATPEAAAASFVKQYGVQPPPPGWGLGRLKGTQKMIYLDAATGEYRDAIPAQ
jgi:hypothetical protein